MSKVALYNLEGKTVGDFELNDAIFGIQPNEAVVHEAVVLQLASLRRGTVGVKNRAAVSGGGRKPFKQKGTGRARAGSSRSPLWRHGGVIFGPQARSYGYSIPRKKRRLALKSVLSDKALNGNLIVVDKIEMDKPSTKTMAANLVKLGAAGKALVCCENEFAALSTRNIAGAKVLNAAGLNVYDILYAEKLIIAKDEIAKIEEVLLDA